MWHCFFSAFPMVGGTITLLRILNCPLFQKVRDFPQDRIRGKKKLWRKGYLRLKFRSFSLQGFLQLQSTYAQDHSEMECVGRQGSLQEVSQYHQFSSFISLCVFLFMQKIPNKQILHGALDRLLWLNGACLVCHFSRKQK